LNIKEILQSLKSSNGKFNGSKIKAAFDKGFLNEILLPFSNTNLTTIQKLWFIDNGCISPNCINCGNEVKNWSENFLCSLCKKTQKTQKQKETFLKNYGTDNPAKVKSIYEKVKQTNLEKYGVENPAQNKEIYNKVKQTNLEKYGVENPSQCDKIKEKKKKTTQQNFGVDYPQQHKDIREKSKSTLIENFGVDNPMRSSEIYDKAKQTNIERYGSEYVSQSMVLQTRKLDPNYESILREKYKEYCDKELPFNWLSRESNIPISLLKTIMFDLNLEIKKHYSNVSSEEYDLYQHITSFYNEEIIQSDRKQLSGKEIDIWLPEKKLGIEYHGLYGHSEKPNAHLEKYKLAKDANIFLIQIFSSEWKNKPEIVSSIIKSKLGIFDFKFHGRKTEVREVSNKEYKLFVDANHIQGNSTAKIKIGLFHENELVSIMSFSKPRFNKNVEWELVRYCNSLNTQIIGGASKLFNYFIKKYKPNTIISYADARYSTGKIYETLGFDFINHSRPNFFYFKNNEEILESRQKYQKYKLEKMFPHLFDKNKTGEQIMVDAGYYKIYDAGNLVFIWKRK